jgi:hypothetical protein
MEDKKWKKEFDKAMKSQKYKPASKADVDRAECIYHK